MKCLATLIAVTLMMNLFNYTSAAEKANRSIRFATYNVSFYRDRQGQLAEDFARGDRRAEQIAEVLQRVRPDVVLLNEFDYDQGGRGVQLFCERYLGESQAGLDVLNYPHVYFAAVNTGLPTSLDLDHDDQTDGPGDAYGFGRYPGQYGMVVLSRFPINREHVRTFQKFKWRDMPGARLPKNPESGENYYSGEALEVFRLSSKSYWDVPIEVPQGGEKKVVHLLCSHPTPPVFDGPEDRNGLRNHDEIRMVADYIDPERSEYLVDDNGKRGGLEKDAAFVIVGDLNADPLDGESAPGAINQLLGHPLVNAESIPASQGAARSSKEHAASNRNHQGDPQHDTADFGGEGHGNLRIDYVLPSRNLRVVGSGVFWPPPGEPGAEPIRATDHRLVYVDLEFASAGEAGAE